jgi:hypothetical protein
MTNKTVKNIAASVRQKLLNKARAENRPFNELLQYYAMERFLYRLSVSRHADKFILKGALMLKVWGAPDSRPTMDIDMLGKTANNIDDIKEKIKDICSSDDDFSDGIDFDSENISAEDITEDAKYLGTRLRIPARFDTAMLKVQLDIGFGDAVYPKPKKLPLPVLLDLPVPDIFCYSKESSISEKFEAMLKLGKLNSRMKDFYDIWLLSRQFDFNGKQLRDAVNWTFKKREVEIPEEIIAFSEEFTETKKLQWNAFRKKLKQIYIPEDFSEVVSAIQVFLSPVIENLRSGKPMPKVWRASSLWK